MTHLRVCVLLLGVSGAACAQDCAEIEDNAERLACYDAAHQAPPSPPAETSAPPPAGSATPAPAAAAPPEAKSAAPVAAAAPDEFGREEPLDAPREYIEATIVEVTTSGFIHYLHLDNGQVWREVEDSTLRFREGRKVTITDGILNSYDLKMEGQNKIVKVRRVR
jgi:hypothetical protein